MTKRLVLLALLVAGGVLVFATGLHRHLEVESLRGLMERAGWLGPVVFLALFGLQPFGLPGILLMLAAIAVWPQWLAFLLSWAGAVIAGCVGYLFARTIGREWVAARLPERLRRFEQQVVERGLRTVIVCRLLFFLTPPAHWALGLSPVGFGTFVLGSAIGFLPGVAVWTLAGGTVLEWYEGRGPQFGLQVLGLLVLAALGWWLWRRVRRAGINAST